MKEESDMGEAYWRFFFSVGMLLAQTVIPLCYYYGMRDPLDERFAWRMFSEITLAERKVEISLSYLNGTTENLNIRKEFDKITRQIIKDGHTDTLKKLCLYLKEKKGAEEVKVSTRHRLLTEEIIKKDVYCDDARLLVTRPNAL